MDLRLLEVLGFKDTIKILTEEKAQQLKHEEAINRRLMLEGGNLGDPKGKDGKYLFGEVNMLGTGHYERSETKT